MTPTRQDALDALERLSHKAIVNNSRITVIVNQIKQDEQTISTYLTAQDWRPIETAPMDGRWIQVFIPGKIVPKKGGYRKTNDYQGRARWIADPDRGRGEILSHHAEDLKEAHGGFWSAHINGRKPLSPCPTHWKPLPEPPTGGRNA